MPILTGKVALITGASSGIGACTAVEFAKLECKLALCGLHSPSGFDNLHRTKHDCISTGKLKDSDVLAIEADVTITSELNQLVSETIKHFGRLDILVNNAGISICGRGAGSDPIEDFDKLMNTNLRGAIQLTQLCLPYLKMSKGSSIVNVSSITSTCPFPNRAYYCMTKAALDSFTQCLALEVASDGIRVNSVNPGAIRTPIYIKGGMNKEQFQQMIESRKDTYPLGRVGEPEEIAKAIAFLASDDSSFITGQILNVCGGISLTNAAQKLYGTKEN